MVILSQEGKEIDWYILLPENKQALEKMMRDACVRFVNVPHPRNQRDFAWMVDDAHLHDARSVIMHYLNTLSIYRGIYV
jgi:hypothetical protein